MIVIPADHNGINSQDEINYAAVSLVHCDAIGKGQDNTRRILLLANTKLTKIKDISSYRKEHPLSNQNTGSHFPGKTIG